MKIAVIDIGSNSVRLLMTSDGKTLYKTISTTRLGEGIACGRLSAAAMERTAKAVRVFCERARGEGAQKIYAFATAAVRSSANREDFVRLVEAECGLQTDVVSGEEEAELGLSGALGREDGAIVDIGGASTELIFRKGGRRVYAQSRYIGAVSLFDSYGRDRKRLTAAIKEAIQGYGTVPACDKPIVAIGGTATSLAALALGLKEYDGAAVQDYRLTRERLEALTDGIFSCTAQELAQTTCLPFQRAEILGGGALTLAAMMDYLSVREAIVSERDNLEGYLLKKEGV